MELATYLSKRGAQAALAAALKVPPALVSQWANKVRPVPIERCAAIEKATQGHVMRWDLCPEWREHWPELARKKSAPARMRSAKEVSA